MNDECAIFLGNFQVGGDSMELCMGQEQKWADNPCGFKKMLLKYMLSFWRALSLIVPILICLKLGLFLYIKNNFQNYKRIIAFEFN
jgi:hypothetical protein